MIENQTINCINTIFDGIIKSRFIEMFGNLDINDKNWPLKTIGDLYKVTSAKRIYQNELSDHGVPFYKVADINKLIDNDGIENNQFISEEKYLELLELGQVPKENDILMTARGTLGRCYIVRKSDRFYFQDGMVSWLISKTNLILNEFFIYYISNDFVINNIKKYTKGSTVDYLSISKTEKIIIPLPDIELQIKFVELLKQIDKSRVIAKQMLAQFDNLVESRFIEMFGDPFVSPIYDRIPFMDCLEFNPKKSQINDLPDDCIVSFVPMESVGTDGDMDVSAERSLGDVRNGYTYFQDGDVVFAKITPCFENGKVAVACGCHNRIGFGSTEFHVARPIKGKSDSIWLEQLLKSDSLRHLASKNMSGTAGQKRVQKPFFEKLTVGLPPIQKQMEFSEFVETANRSKREFLDELKTRLEKQTGEVEG